MFEMSEAITNVLLNALDDKFIVLMSNYHVKCNYNYIKLTRYIYEMILTSLDIYSNPMIIFLKEH